MPRIYTYTAGDAQSHKELGKKLAELKPGNYIVTIKKNNPVRSLRQNAYYHVILSIIGIESGHTHEQLHDIMKKKFNAELVPFPKSGTEIHGKSTAGLDSAAFTGYVNRVKQWAMDEFGIVIPERENVDQRLEQEIHNTYEGNQNG